MIVMVIVGMRAVLIMVMMAMPVIMSVAVTFVLVIVPRLFSSSRHEHLEVFRAVGVIMVLTERPVVEQRIAGHQARF